MKLLISDRTELGQLDLPVGIEVVVVDENRPVPVEHQDATGVVIWGVGEQVGDFLSSLPNLGWVQTYLAGPDRIMALGLPDQVVVTNGVHFHDDTVAEHTVALTLALLRRLPEALVAQADHRWAGEMGGVQPLHPGNRVTSLIGARVVVWGFGAIGQRIASLVSGFGAVVSGIANSAGHRAGFEVTDRVDSALAEADVLIMVLPHRVDTIEILNERTISLLPNRAVVINVGRGSAIDEDALVAALKDGRLGGAGLDVTRVEPLPMNSPLWDAPNIIITPHGAGGRPVGAEQRIAHNLRAFLGEGDYIGRMSRP